ncbi:MAG: hypothetical protein NTX84_00285 [Nitrospirae bacterium]|nr:hypothetical protein [Nitrospirota bacterium]
MLRTIPHAICKDLVTSLDFGGITAESDGLLLEARIQTPTFEELLKDKIDLVMGCKGSGKTAMFRLCMDLSGEFLEDFNIALLNGADEQKQEPVFQRYIKEFEKYSEDDFQVFWKVYFIYLLNDCVFRSPKYKERLKCAAADIKRFEAAAKKSEIQVLKTHNSLFTIIHSAISSIKSIKKVEGKIGIDGSISAGIELRQPAKDTETATPLFISALLDSIHNVLKKANLRIWIMLDRLDEVFPRHSEIERRALRSLLRCIRVFQEEHIRIKVFLRDDIFESVTEGGFAALTHITDRCSSSLNWDADEITHLVLKRALQSEEVRKHFNADNERCNTNQQYRSQLFYSMFPRKINGDDTIKWLYAMCQDGKDVVAPRDIIELMREAKRIQFKKLNSTKDDQDWLISPSCFAEGFTAMSKKKKDVLLKAEFPDLFPHMLCFEQSKAEHKETSLKLLLGRGWRSKIKSLESIGFVRADRSKKTWTIPHLYRPCFEIRNGRAKTT